MILNLESAFVLSFVQLFCHCSCQASVQLVTELELMANLDFGKTLTDEHQSIAGQQPSEDNASTQSNSTYYEKFLVKSELKQIKTSQFCNLKNSLQKLLELRDRIQLVSNELGERESLKNQLRVTRMRLIERCLQGCVQGSWNDYKNELQSFWLVKQVARYVQAASLVQLLRNAKFREFEKSLDLRDEQNKQFRLQIERRSVEASVFSRLANKAAVDSSATSASLFCNSVMLSKNSYLSLSSQVFDLLLTTQFYATPQVAQLIDEECETKYFVEEVYATWLVCKSIKEVGVQ